MIDVLRTEAAARTASQVGRWSAAEPLWSAVVARNPVNGNHWHQLAEARWSLDDVAGALEAYREALRLGVWRPNVMLFPADLEYRIAACHARLGSSSDALSALRRAVDLGLRDLDGAWSDPAFAPLRSDPWFEATFAPASASDLDREAGWKLDLAWFSREVSRRAYRVPPSFAAGVAALEADVPSLTDAQVFVRLCALLRPFGDGHAFVDLPSSGYDSLRAALPLRCFLFEEGLYVTSVLPGWESLLGKRILRIDGKPVEDVIAAVDPLISRDNEQWPRYAVANWLRRVPFLHALGVASSPVELALGLSDADADVVVPASARYEPTAGEWTAPPGWVPLVAEPPLHLRNPGTLYWFRDLPELDAVYFQFSGVGHDSSESFDAFTTRLFDHLHDAGRLIIDLRWNPGGNTFLVQPMLTRLAASPVNRPGRLFVVIGRKTYSAAQNTAVFLERQTHAIFVGEPTGSSPNFIGETTPFSLPWSRFEVNVSDLYWQSSWPMDPRPWIAPALYAPPTFAAYAAGRDPALEAIAAVLASGDHLPGW